MLATFLEAGLTTAQWLVKIICCAYDVDIAPAERRFDLIAPLYEGKGLRQVARPYWRIGLVSVDGKVYAALLLHRTG
eukprot:366525-Chlamydomonas_euryale.AAC.10